MEQPKLSRQEVERLWKNAEYVSSLLAQVDMSIQMLRGNIQQIEGWVDPEFYHTVNATAEWLQEYFGKALQDAQDVIGLMEEAPKADYEAPAMMQQPLDETVDYFG